MSHCYKFLAPFYNKFTKDDGDYDRWAEYILKAAHEHGSKRGVDIACGTGKMAKRLCAAGLNMIGVDKSTRMLMWARDDYRTLWVYQDMRKLKLIRLADIAVCVNDGINYLKPTELDDFFLHVHDNMTPGGPFIFDISTPYKMAGMDKQLYYWDDDKATLFWNNKFTGRRLIMDLVLFVKMTHGAYLRKEEQHIQYPHTIESITAAVERNGFTMREVTESYGLPLRPESDRWTFYAVRDMR